MASGVAKKSTGAPSAVDLPVILGFEELSDYDFLELILQNAQVNLWRLQNHDRPLLISRSLLYVLPITNLGPPLSNSHCPKLHVCELVQFDQMHRCVNFVADMHLPAIPAGNTTASPYYYYPVASTIIIVGSIIMTWVSITIRISPR